MEDLTLKIVCKAEPGKVREFLQTQGFVRPERRTGFLDGEELVIETEEYVIEALLEPRAKGAEGSTCSVLLPADSQIAEDEIKDVKLSLRFALANTEPVDRRYCEVVMGLLALWPGDVYFMSGTRKDLDFSKGQQAEILEALQEQIPLLRAHWRRLTGSDKTGPVHVRDAYSFAGLV